MKYHMSSNQTDHALEVGLNEAGRSWRRLKDQDNFELARKWLAGDRYALHDLIERNLLFVVTVARQSKFQGRGLSLDELISAGNVGLVRAAEKYNPEYGYLFTSYAVWWIEQSIKKAFADESRVARIPQSVIHQLRRFQIWVKRYHDEHRRWPQDDEIAEGTGIHIDKVASLWAYLENDLSLNHVYGGDDFTLTEMLHSPHDPNFEMEAVALREDLDAAMQFLPPRHRLVIIMNFGLDGEGERTLEVIGKAIGNVSRERVRQIRNEALAVMKRKAPSLAEWTANGKAKGRP